MIAKLTTLALILSACYGCSPAHVRIDTGYALANPCPVTITVSNKTAMTDWSAINMGIAFQDARGATVGEISGGLQWYTQPGSSLSLRNEVAGVACRDIAGATLVYFSYTPIGIMYRGNVTVWNAGIELR